LWVEVAAAIRKQPLLGYGFDAFWTLPTGAAGVIVQDFTWASHAHNGLLDLCLQLGAAGVAVFVIGFAAAVRGAVAAYVDGDGRQRLWPLAYLAFLFFYNLTESATLAPKSAFLMLYAAVAVGVSVRRRQTAAATTYDAPSGSRRILSARGVGTVPALDL
jgi:O-antigen ligase